MQSAFSSDCSINIEDGAIVFVAATVVIGGCGRGGSDVALVVAIVVAFVVAAVAVVLAVVAVVAAVVVATVDVLMIVVVCYFVPLYSH